MSQIHGYLNSTPDDYGHKWSPDSDHERVECSRCGDSYNSKKFCTNKLVVSDQLDDMDRSMSAYYGEEG